MSDKSHHVELSLAPLDEQTPPLAKDVPSKTCMFERRSGDSRRCHTDRREEIRFCEDRRQCPDRRKSGRSWDNQHGI